MVVVTEIPLLKPSDNYIPFYRITKPTFGVGFFNFSIKPLSDFFLSFGVNFRGD